MNRPAKLGRKKNPSGTPSNKAEGRPKSGSRDPLKELSNSSVRASHFKEEGTRRGCFGFLLPNSSSSSSSSATTITATSSSARGPLPRSKSLPRTPKSAPPNSRTLQPLNSHGEPPELRPRVAQKKPSRPSCEKLKHSRSDKHPKPTSRLILQWRNRGEADPEVSFPKKDAGARSRGTAMAVGKPSIPTLEMALGGVNGFNPEEGALTPLASEICLGLDLGEAETPVAKLSYGSVLHVTPGKEGEEQQQRQHSHTPASTRTATPPVQASVSPELGAQSVQPISSCFAAGHLIAGVQDRRKCRPRGILNVGGCGLVMADGGGLGSSGAPGNGFRASLTPPSPVEASVQWLSSPCNGESSRLSTISPTSSKVSLGVLPAEASVNWFLSPSENETDACVLEENVQFGSNTLHSGATPLSDHRLWSASPSSITETTGNSPRFGGLINMNSPKFENTPSATEICCSPATSSGVSPFSMIIQNAAASASFKDHSQQDNGRYCYGSLVNNSPFSGDLHGNSNVICTPSSCSCTSGKAGSLSTFDLHTMAEAAETLSSSSPPCEVLASDSKEFLPLFAPGFELGCPTPSNSIDLACFQKHSRHRGSVKEESQTRGENLSSSENRISWREGLISRIFEMDEFNSNSWSSDKEDVDYHDESRLTFKLDVKSDWDLGGSMFKESNEQDMTNGFGSFEFVGHKQSEAKCSSPSKILCAESLSIEVDGLVASDDSDWTLFFKNHLFEG